MTPVPRVVFDCNTFLQAFANPDGPAGRCMQLAIDNEVNLFISPVVLAEFRHVTARPNVIKKLRLQPDGLDEFIEAVEIAATLLDGFPEVFTYLRDPDDAHYINLALAADAKLIVSRDCDLLDLMDPTKPEAADFQRAFPSLRIVNPAELLRQVGSW